MTEQNPLNHGDAARYMKARELDVSDPRNVTAHNAQARMLALGLTGKKRASKADTDKAKGLLVFLHANPDYDPDNTIDNEIADAPSTAPEADDEGGVDDPRTEDGTDGSSHATTGDDEIEAGSEHEAEAGDEAEADAEEGDEEEAKPSSSVVPVKYRQMYKERGDARGNGDWLQRFFKCLLDPKRRLNLPRFVAICEMNEVSIDKYMTEDKQTRSGWQGRARMQGGIALRPVVAAENALNIPTAVYDQFRKKLEENGFIADEEQEEADVLIRFTPPAEFVTANLPSAKEDSKAE
jgi:hypothetical protein